MEHTRHSFLMSRRPAEFSGVMAQSAGGKQAMTALENSRVGMSCSRRMTCTRGNVSHATGRWHQMEAP